MRNRGCFFHSKSIDGADQSRMEAQYSELPLLRQIHLRPTWTGNGAVGDIQQASLIFTVKNLGRSPRLVGQCSNALCLHGCHRLPDRGRLESDVDGCLPSQGHTWGAAVVAIQYLSIYRDPNLEHPQHHNENMDSDRGRCPIHGRDTLCRLHFRRKML